jgi:hypothetical protein
MFLYIPDELSVDEAKAIAVKVLALAYDQEEAKLQADADQRGSRVQLRHRVLPCRSCL